LIASAKALDVDDREPVRTVLTWMQFKLLGTKKFHRRGAGKFSRDGITMTALQDACRRRGSLSRHGLIDGAQWAISHI